MRFIGLMSGTSLDGIDAAIVSFDGPEYPPKWRLEAFRSTAYTSERRERIHHAIAAGDAHELCRLNTDLGEWFAEAAIALCADAGLAPADITGIGSHGQTVWHEPPADGRRGSTLQLGCAATIAERTGITVISDFRSRDVAAGGHGAPLVPFVDRALFAAADRARVLVNIGGMANLTRVPPRGAGDPLLAFDTGPGNALIDAAVEQATGGRDRFDRDGEIARRGSVIQTVLEELLDNPYFSEPPPRSTGRERFGRAAVHSLVERTRPANEAAWADLVATLTQFTVVTIADAIRAWVLPLGVDEVVITGGGVKNPAIVGGIRSALRPLSVVPGTDVGIEPDAKEAIAFAALAWAHTVGVPGNVPEATGAIGPRILGSRTPA